MARSVWKAPFCEPSVLKLVSKALEKGSNALIKTRARASTILHNFVGLKFAVYNGKDFIPFRITDGMIGHKLGEFSPTRKYNGHSANKKVIRK